jgi:L-lactate dehydrogenase
VVESIALDGRKILPVSTLQQGLYGIRDVCLSVPTIVGCGGVRQQVELALTQRERLGIQQSARVLRETIDQVEARIGKVQAVSHATATPAPNNSSRGVPRSAWAPARR